MVPPFGFARREEAFARHIVGVAELSLDVAFEAIIPRAIVLTSSASVDIATPPARVWRAVTHIDPFGSRPGLLFRAGSPIRARIMGEGIGATRIGVFSTGTAANASLIGSLYALSTKAR